MRVTGKAMLDGFLVTLAALVGPAAAAAPSRTLVQCSWHAQNQNPFSDARGTQRGSVRCSDPLGKGGYRSRYRDTIMFTTPLTSSQKGSSNLVFKSGTVRGTYALRPGVFSGKTHYHGTFHITGGTGEFKHARGTLHMTCTVHVPEQACTASGPVSGI